MTTYATPDTARLRAELDDLTRVRRGQGVWKTDDLEGAPYDAAEASEWDQLQATLRELDTARAELAQLPTDD